GLSQLVFGLYDGAALAFSIWITCVALVYFTHAQFGLPTPSRSWFWLLAIVLVLIIIRPFSRLAPALTMGFTAFVVLYQIWKLVPLTRQRPPPLNTWTLILCWAIIGATAWPDFLAWTGKVYSLGGLRAGCLGLTICLILQSAFLSRAHSHSLIRADEL